MNVWSKSAIAHKSVLLFLRDEPGHRDKFLHLKSSPKLPICRLLVFLSLTLSGAASFAFTPSSFANQRRYIL